MSCQFNHQTILFRANRMQYSISFYDLNSPMQCCVTFDLTKIIIIQSHQSSIQIRRRFLRRVCHEKGWRYAKLNRVLNEFDLTQNETEWPNSEFETAAVTTGEAKQLRTHEVKLTAHFAEFDRENLQYPRCDGRPIATPKTGQDSARPYLDLLTCEY